MATRTRKVSLFNTVDVTTEAKKARIHGIDITIEELLLDVCPQLAKVSVLADCSGCGPNSRKRGRYEICAPSREVLQDLRDRLCPDCTAIENGALDRAEAAFRAAKLLLVDYVSKLLPELLENADGLHVGPEGGIEHPSMITVQAVGFMGDPPWMPDWIAQDRSPAALQQLKALAERLHTQLYPYQGFLLLDSVYYPEWLPYFHCFSNLERLLEHERRREKHREAQASAT